MTGDKSSLGEALVRLEAEARVSLGTAGSAACSGTRQGGSRHRGWAQRCRSQRVLRVSTNAVFSSLLVQPSVLGSGIQTISSSNAVWKTNSLGVESISRQRSSSDPPAIHAPVPPLRVTSTSMCPLPCLPPALAPAGFQLHTPAAASALTVAWACHCHPVTL